ncbi:OmpW/AlkL family protein [Paraburkholderia caballeronis]|uniref:Outer membrane protein n=1 Tax=Paraburkholderia caballeronis TaxID=416943 RepID=A0A1H7UXJ4_9BURK|nr:OmpW family outer membrane protein [Paraburkholderia caballeronis]PXW17395.1 outer membrane protein [Paraburkholderia caballeronis]PXW94847.1 outer membrane protein [Paraburkholderia caballeronis]RAJ90745.1 outer membrane protein [Paraburkholderia caballeronis]TDV05639.1 outer membrane protein [Paraburkholderia caballeronis]TDV09380.1 outer membrane protein [Paraburkholderia caballeronis]
MKYKQALAGLAALASLSSAHAQSANTLYFTTGWFRFMPQDSSKPLKLDSAGGTPINAEIPNTGAGVDSSDTAGLSVGYFITDHIATEFEGGIPPKFNLNGEGLLGQFGKVGSARLWAPALLFKYYFNKPEAKFRPYLGLGVTYVWFSDAKITNGAFEQGALGGPTSVSTDRSWAPVINAGFNYSFTKHWFAGFSLSYIPVSVLATLHTQTQSQIPITRQYEAKIHLNPLVTYVKIGYMF